MFDTPALHVLLCGLSISWLLSERPRSYGTSAATTPPIESLARMDSPERVASAAQESEHLAIGSPQLIEQRLQSENNPALVSSELLTASSRSRRAAANNIPSSSAAPYPPNQGSSSWGYGYTTQAAPLEPGAEYFHNYDVNHGEPMAQLQPFEWQLQPFHYYQLVMQWGLVPVPLDSNRSNPPIHPAPVTTPASFPSANPPYGTSSIAHSFTPTGASRSSLIPSSTPGLARQERSTRQPSSRKNLHETTTKELHQIQSSSRPRPESSDLSQKQENINRNKSVKNMMKKDATSSMEMDHVKPLEILRRVAQPSSHGDGASPNQPKVVQQIWLAKKTKPTSKGIDVSPTNKEPGRISLANKTRDLSSSSKDISESLSVSSSGTHSILTEACAHGKDITIGIPEFPREIMDSGSSDTLGIQPAGRGGTRKIKAGKRVTVLPSPNLGHIRLKESASSSARKSKDRTDDQESRGPESPISEPKLIGNPGAKEEKQSDKKESIDHSSNQDTPKTALSSAQEHPAKQDLKEAKEYEKPDKEEAVGHSNNQKNPTTEVSSSQEHYPKEDCQGAKEEKPDKKKEVDHLKNQLNPTTEVFSGQENSAIADPKGAKGEEEKLDKDEAVNHLSNQDTSTTELSSPQDHPSTLQGHPAKEDHNQEATSSKQSLKQTRHSSFTNEENQGVWRNTKQFVGITLSKNKFDLQTNHEELVASPKTFFKQDLEAIPEIFKENSGDIGQIQKSTASNARARLKSKYKKKSKYVNLAKGKLEISDSKIDEESELKHNSDATHESASSSTANQATSKSNVQKFNPNNIFSEEHRSAWIRTLKGNLPQELLNLFFKFNLIFNSYSQTRVFDLFSKFQTFIKKSPAADKVDGMTNETFDLGGKSQIRSQEDSEKTKEFQLTKTGKDELKGKTGHKKHTFELVECKESSSEIPEYEIKYLKAFPKTCPKSLSLFRILGTTLNAGKKAWDFSIGINMKNIKKAQQKHLINVLKCKTSELQEQCMFLMNEIGYPEGERRYEAIQAQIRQAEVMEKWAKFIISPSSRPIKEKLIMVDSVLQLSKPWPPERDLQTEAMLKLESIFKENTRVEKKLKKSLGNIINQEEFSRRMREAAFMFVRWNPHNWLSREERMLIHQQALDLRLILLVGDCLQFGRKVMTNSLVKGTIRPEYAFELLITIWNHRKSTKCPWFETPERAWLLMDPERSKLYKERLNTLKEYFEDYQASNYQLVSIVDKERKFQWYSGTPWWHLGHILLWQDQGLDSSTMARLGNKMKLKKEQEGLSPEQIQILKEAFSKEEIPENKKNIIPQWFHNEFHQSFLNKIMKNHKSLVHLLPGNIYSDIVTYYKGISKPNFLLPDPNFLNVLQEV